MGTKRTRATLFPRLGFGLRRFSSTLTPNVEPAITLADRRGRVAGGWRGGLVRRMAVCTRTRPGLPAGGGGVRPRLADAFDADSRSDASGGYLCDCPGGGGWSAR